MQDLLRQYGLWAVFFGAMIEGDLTLLLTGVMAHYGLFPLQDAFIVGTAGGVAGDLLGYLIGHLFRNRARTLRFFVRARPRIERLMRRFGGYSLFLVKYIYGLRTATAVFCGLAHFGLARFAPLTMLSCVVWVLIFAGGGYFFTNTITRLLGDIHSIKIGILVVIILAALALGIKRYRLGRHVIPE